MPRESRDALENLPKEAPRQAAVCAIDAELETLLGELARGPVAAFAVVRTTA
jgi:hypothetical protein